MKRVVVTGLGAVSPLGIGVPALWEGLVAGRSGVRRVQHFDTENLTVKIAAEVPDFDPKAFMDPKSVRRMDRFAQFAIAGTREALADAKLEISDENRDRVAVVMNTGGGGIPTIESNVTAMAVHGPSRVGPLVIPMFAPNMASSQVSIAFGIHGPTITSAAACASGVQAFVDAVRLLQAGEADIAVTGGTEAGITPVALTSLANMHALSRRNDDPEGASRPFDRERDGFVFGEGAGVLILETEEHAVRRGASVYAESIGGALTSDAFHLTAPEPSGRGARMAMTNALKRAEMEPHEPAGGHLGQQVDGRALVGGGRRHLGRRLRPGDSRWGGAADDQSRPSGSGLRPRLHTARGPSDARARRDGQRFRLRRPERLDDLPPFRRVAAT
ncbi:MAG: fabF [Thermomicrobiales bacterium]|nr:fabF [Thermomicrobiales bacterium]